MRLSVQPMRKLELRESEIAEYYYLDLEDGLTVNLGENSLLQFDDICGLILL